MHTSPGITSQFVLLRRSERTLPAGAQIVGSVDAEEQISVSIILRPFEPLNLIQMSGQRLSREEYSMKHGADPAVAHKVARFAVENRLVVDDAASSLTRRTIVLRGTAFAMQQAFGVKLNHYQYRDRDGVTQSFRGRAGVLRIPTNLADCVEAVLGLDNRPQATTHFRRMGGAGTRSAAARQTDQSYTPVQVAQLYNFPKETTGMGQTIGIIELGGGYQTADLQEYFKKLGRTPPSIVAVSVDGGQSNPGDPNGPDVEVMLDVEVAAAVAPEAKIVVYFAPNTDRGFHDAISTAIHDTTNNPSVISISWGASESNWTQQAMLAFDHACQSAAVLGVTITVSSGDNGSTDGMTDNGNHVDFPASSPHVLACGGTSLTAANGTVTSETVWNDLPRGGATGGGVSTIFSRPDYQKDVKVPSPMNGSGGRGVPDVAADADPKTGYQIQVDGKSSVVGGTSAVAPLWAGLVALLNQNLGRPVGFLNPQLYAGAGAGAMRDITRGNNGAFTAGVGWDPCTGLGSPDGARLELALRQSAARRPSQLTAGHAAR
jgi:kumamolisin